ncbi:MAG: type I-U CRISPR-associated protein Cas5/Cas6 [Rhodospirillales bacterium]|nr:type I-U CRISPR-associated protein Cas5/Cas6 [Rhodospirillales bacterium]
MVRALLLSVRFHDGRYHGVSDGVGDWPPAPARLFQALLAGGARGGVVAEEATAALRWLEGLAPPSIAAPPGRTGVGHTTYVPNNDLDAALREKKHGGNLAAAVASIRVGKTIRPQIFKADMPFLYMWTVDDDPENDVHASYVCAMAEDVFQLGRGVDMAWACGEMLDGRDGEKRLADHANNGGVVYRPGGNGSRPLACPVPGSLDSLIARHRAFVSRFSPRYRNKPTKKDPAHRVPDGLVFAQPPKPRFNRIAYGSQPCDSPPWHRVYEIRDTAGQGWQPQSASDAVQLVERVRDLAAARLISGLASGLPKRQAEIERLVIGRGAGPRDKSARIRIVPLPSIGHKHADYGIRRLLVEVPPDCRIESGDIDWAFAGLDLGRGRRLLPTAADTMLKHYGIADEKGHRSWRSVTPVALPFSARRAGGRKSAPVRLEEEARATGAVTRALRHAGIAVPPMTVRVQREPFDAKGTRAEAFAAGRFCASRLWHLEIVFREPVPGPLAIGDGRYVGLGLMQPVRRTGRGLWVFAMPPENRIGVADTGPLLEAVRRALMALSRCDDGNVPLLFCGHEGDGPARSGRHRHIFLTAEDADGDGHLDRLLVAAPWLCDRSRGAPKPAERAMFDEIVPCLRRLRAGRLGVLEFAEPVTPPEGDPIVGPARAWTSRTPYRPTRHASRGRDAEAAVCEDAALECRRRGLPVPCIDVLAFRAGPKGGNPSARLRLRFTTAVDGPLLLGRDSHRGGGLFVAESPFVADNNGDDDIRRPV